MTIAELSELNRYFFYAFVSIPSILISVFLILLIIRVWESVNYAYQVLKDKEAQNAIKRVKKKKKQFNAEKARVKRLKENYKDEMRA